MFYLLNYTRRFPPGGMAGPGASSPGIRRLCRHGLGSRHRIRMYPARIGATALSRLPSRRGMGSPQETAGGGSLWGPRDMVTGRVVGLRPPPVIFLITAITRPAVWPDDHTGVREVALR